MNDRLVSPHDTPVLVVKTPGAEQRLDGGSSHKIGRDPQSDIVVSDSRVSWQHAVLRPDHGAWVLEDAGSTNGTFMGTRKVQRVEIGQDCVLRLGNPDDGPVMYCSVVRADADGRPGDHGLSGVDRRPTSVMRAPVKVLRIGRAPDNDLVVPDLSVSRHHAEMRNVGGGRYEIVDLGSHNGVFVNGERVTIARMTEQDIVGIGRATFRLVGDELREFIDEGNVGLVAQDLTVRISGGKVLLDHVSFPIGERSLVAIIGPSGAGKTTLLGALTGMRPATEGNVLYDNRDLYANYSELRHRIGLVPQENILHTQLSARRALRYAAELRFPRDTSARERNGRVEEVIDELGLKAHAQTRAGSLSGGQQKRVNVALELLTKPSLLFLDEPTSGLDPGLDKSVMEMMAELAHDGRTVIVVTHSVANLDLCDRLLVLVPGGKVAYYGPPADGLRHFGKPGWAEVFQAFDAEPDRDWAGEFKRSAFCAQYVTSGLTSSRAPASASRQTAPAPRTRNRLAQFSTLCRRYVAVIASDRVFLAFLAGAPIALSAIIRVLPSPEGLAGAPHTNGDAEALLLILSIAACFTGALNAVREIVKERPIYSRERAAGLSVGSYLWSKVAILGVISALQAAVMVVGGLAGRKMPAHGVFIKSVPMAELAVAMGFLAIASMALGLLISASVSTSEKSLPLLFVSVMAQVVFTGGVVPLYGKVVLQQLSWLSPSRWGFAATADTINLVKIVPPLGGKPDPLWAHKPTTWLFNMGMMAVLGLVFTFITWLRLQRLGPGRARR